MRGCSQATVSSRGTVPPAEGRDLLSGVVGEGSPGSRRSPRLTVAWALHSTAAGSINALGGRA